MTNNANNNTPTAPGYHYRSGRIVLVATNLATNLYSGLVYCEVGSAAVLGVEDDGLWLGPVPMPGEWVPRELADCLYYEALGVDNNDSELLRRYEEFIGDEVTR
jgi:hypothetical protein